MEPTTVHRASLGMSLADDHSCAPQGSSPRFADEDPSRREHCQGKWPPSPGVAEEQRTRQHPFAGTHKAQDKGEAGNPRCRVKGSTRGSEVIEGGPVPVRCFFFFPSGAGPGRFTVSTWAEDPQGRPFHPRPPVGRSLLPRTKGARNRACRARDHGWKGEAAETPGNLATTCTQSWPPSHALSSTSHTIYVISREVASSVSASHSPPYLRHLGAPRSRCGAGGGEKVKKKRRKRITNNLCLQATPFDQRFPVQAGGRIAILGTRHSPPTVHSIRSSPWAPAGSWARRRRT